MTSEIAKLKEWVDGCDNIVFFGGAGVSTESGIPDFRSVDGLYNQQYKYPPETILSHTFFLSETAGILPVLPRENARARRAAERRAPQARRMGARGQVPRCRHAEHRRTASEGRLEGGVRAAWLGAPQLLHALPQAVSGREDRLRHRHPEVRLRRHDQAGCRSV